MRNTNPSSDYVEGYQQALRDLGATIHTHAVLVSRDETVDRVTDILLREIALAAEHPLELRQTLRAGLSPMESVAVGLIRGIVAHAIEKTGGPVPPKD